MNWFKQTLANVAGTQEPEYGPSAIQTVTDQAKDVPYTEMTEDHLKWVAMESTCVETQQFYFQTEDGRTCMCQVIYSNVMGVRTTCQFNSKIYDHDGHGKHQWLSDPVHHHHFDKRSTNFYANDLSVELSEDLTTYTIKSSVNKDNIVDLVVTRTAPGFVAGKDGHSHYGTDHANPWGMMRHAFWPRATVTGTMKTHSKTYPVNGRATFVMANQGMKPHHAAARWNFVDFHTPTYSAVMMEFTTPPSYGRTVVNVGAIAKDGELLQAGVTNTAKHLAAKVDPETDWPEPKALLCTWNNKNKDGTQGEAELMGDLSERADKVDVLAHVPAIIKSIIGSVANTKPIIFQYIIGDKMTLKVKDNGEEKSEQGRLFYEATFIS